VTGAELANGLLSIELARPQPESVTRRIDIRSGNNGTGQGEL
jgi:HSP20 family molecular chaperone IbpA